MTSGMWLNLIACAGLLALAGLVLARVGRNPLALPLSLLSIILSTWNFTGFALERSGEPGWRLVSFAAMVMTLPSTLHFILTFVGRRRRSAWAMYGTYGAMGALALVLLAALGAPALATKLSTWHFGLIATLLVAPPLCGGFALLGLHLRDAKNPDERARAGLVVVGLGLLVGMMLTEFAQELGLSQVPLLGNVGTLLGLPMMTLAALRIGLFERDVGSEAHWMALLAVPLAAVGVLAYLAVFRLFATQVSVLVVLTTAITFALLVAARRGVTAFVTRGERMKRLATMGRFSAQMAHDLKNPIAALKGAAQYLKEEHARGQSWDHQGEFLDLMLEQVDRVGRVVDTYQRMSRVEPRPHPVDLGRLVESVLSLQSFASPGQTTILRHLEPGLPPCAADADLLSNALENLVRNGIEAMPQGGTLTVRTLRDGKALAVEVEDTGEGMDARTRERAFDDFFTTKSSGSGLGLAFVRRVVEAHGGTVRLTTREGHGTVVRLRLPEAVSRDAGGGIEGEAA